MTQIQKLYTYLHNISRQKRCEDLYRLLSLFTDEELAEAADALSHVQAIRQMRIPLKVSLSQ